MFFCPMKTVSSANCLRKDSISDDLPEPATPAITVITPKGSLSETFFKLCSDVGASANQPVGLRSAFLNGVFLFNILPVRLPQASSPS